MKIYDSLPPEPCLFCENRQSPPLCDFIATDTVIVRGFQLQNWQCTNCEDNFLDYTPLYSPAQIAAKNEQQA